MITKQIFEEGDLEELSGIPLIELSDDFETFSYNDLSFTVEKRIKMLTILHYPKKYGDKTLYHLGCINCPVIMKTQLFTEQEMLDKLNNSERWYRICTNKEIEYVYKKIFSYNDKILSYEKIKHNS